MSVNNLTVFYFILLIVNLLDWENYFFDNITNVIAYIVIMLTIIYFAQFVMDYI